MKESLADRLRRCSKEIKKKDPELYQKMLDDGGLTEEQVSDIVDNVETIEQQQEEK